MVVCETNSSSFLYWTISVPDYVTVPERIITNQGVMSLPAFTINSAEFHISRISESPLISRLVIDNVTTGINGSNIYCSEDGNKGDAPVVEINIMGSTISKYICMIIVKCPLVHYINMQNF